MSDPKIATTIDYVGVLVLLIFTVMYISMMVIVWYLLPGNWFLQILLVIAILPIFDFADKFYNSTVKYRSVAKGDDL